MKNICFVLIWLLTARMYQCSNFSYKYAITDPDYEGAVSDGYNDKYQLQNVYMHSDNFIDGKSAFKECFRYCVKKKGCITFVINNKLKRCFLTNFDRCKEPRVFLRRYDEFTTYEMRDRIDNTFTMQTCFQQCLVDNGTTCEECSRIYCSGLQCDNCNKTCWKIPELMVGTTYFWVNLQQPKYVYCDKEWQQIFSGGNLDVYPELYNDPKDSTLLLRVNVRYNNKTDNRNKVSYFDGFKDDGGGINVGDYLGGDAGNNWGAKFDKKPIITFVNSTCYNFYYNDKSDCNITALPTYAEQIKSGTKPQNVQKGYVWNICDEQNPSDVYVEDISFYITPKTDTLMKDIESNHPKKTCS